MQESETHEGHYVWRSVPDALMASCGTQPDNAHGTQLRAWSPVTRNKVLARRHCGCLTVSLYKNAKKAADICAVCALRTHVARVQEKAAFEQVKDTIASHSDGWYVIREWRLSGEDSNMSVDSMLVHGCTGTRGIAPFKQTMIAVELDGKSHGDEPFLFGKERWVAMEAQRKRDVAKDAALKRSGWTAVRINTQKPESFELLAKAMADIARMNLSDHVS